MQAAYRGSDSLNTSRKVPSDPANGCAQIRGRGVDTSDGLVERCRDISRDPFDGRRKAAQRHRSVVREALCRNGNSTDSNRRGGDHGVDSSGRSSLHGGSGRGLSGHAQGRATRNLGALHDAVRVEDNKTVSLVVGAFGLEEGHGDGGFLDTIDECQQTCGRLRIGSSPITHGEVTSSNHNQSNVVILGSSNVLVENLDEELGGRVAAGETGNVERDLGEIGVLVPHDRGGNVLLEPTGIGVLLAGDTDARIELEKEHRRQSAGGQGFDPVVLGLH